MNPFTPVHVKRALMHVDDPIYYGGIPVNEYFLPGNTYSGRQTISLNDKFMNAR
ncbi:hypothetical protein Slin15195_G043710 [Septoria linicola]|uniref:Uncharacterized protein n=1 Tax=Septoria linicola TaxID=215465 RepID=A0A9Q9AKG2_9PEZI|nr:hypothetical protein Slin14017_G047230 [Septoria linicola]USW51052.1 hypothetical protein Slin15195_G043710 [Septoria linicola]